MQIALHSSGLTSDISLSIFTSSYSRRYSFATNLFTWDKTSRYSLFRNCSFSDFDSSSIIVSFNWDSFKCTLLVSLEHVNLPQCLRQGGN